MVNYFRLVSAELLIKLNQIKEITKNHNPTTGLLTEEILRSFLKCYLPKSVSVEQGFVLSQNGKMSKQCDILIYDSFFHEDEKGTEVIALQAFYLSVYESIEIHHSKNKKSIPIKSYFGKNNFKKYSAFGLFDI